MLMSSAKKKLGNKTTAQGTFLSNSNNLIKILKNPKYIKKTEISFVAILNSAVIFITFFSKLSKSLPSHDMTVAHLLMLKTNSEYYFLK
jgi:hypothetical protein